MNNNVLLTGVAGFIGSKLAEHLLYEGYNVIGIDDLSVGDINNIPDKTEFYKHDLSKPIDINFKKKIGYVLHLAGQSSGEISFDNPIVDLEKNTFSTINLIDFSNKHQIEKFLYASSMSVYGESIDKNPAETSHCLPKSCYGISKLASENYLRILSKKFKYINIRMFNVYGPGQNLNNFRQGMVSIFIQQALVDGVFNIKGSIDRFRDFIYIDVVVKIWYYLMKSDMGNSEINLGTGYKTYVRELLEEIKINTGKLETVINNNTPGDQFGIYSNNQNLNKFLPDDYQFVSLSEGIKKTLNWANDKS